MQIPGVGQFGNDIAAPPQAVSVPRLDGGQGLQSAGGAIQNIGGQELAIDRQRIVEAAQARTALAMAKTSNAVQDAHDEVARGVLTGEIPTDKAGAELQDRISKARDQNLSGLLPEQRQVIDSHLETVAGSAQRSMVGVVAKRQMNETASTIDQFDEEQQRAALNAGTPAKAIDNFNTMVDFAGPAAGMVPAEIAKRKQNFKEKTTFNFYDAVGTAALTRGDIPGVTDALNKVMGPDGEAMDPLRRIRLTHQLYGYQQHLVAQQARDENAAANEQRIKDNIAVGLLNQGMDLFQQGQQFSPDFIKQLSEASAGTSSQDDVGKLLSAQALGAGFASKTAATRDAAIAKWQSEAATPGQGTDPLQAKGLQTLVAMNAKLKKATDENPWAAAASVGVIPEQQQMNAANPQSAVAAMAERMKNIGVVEEWASESNTGKAGASTKVSPLMPGEADQVAKLLRVLPADQAASMMYSFGTTIGDPDRIAALARQLKDKDGTLALGMLYAGTPHTTQGRDIAELLLRGEQALKDKADLIDNAAQTGWKAAIAKQINGAYSTPEVQEQVKRAAFLITAAKAGEDGSADIDNAVKLATGGITERNGAKVPLPYGMKERDFDKKVDGVTAQDFAGQAPGDVVMAGRTQMPLADFVAAVPKAPLVHAGPGLYNIRSGTSLVTDAAGKRITLKVTP